MEIPIYAMICENNNTIVLSLIIILGQNIIYCVVVIGGRDGVCNVWLLGTYVRWDKGCLVAELPSNILPVRPWEVS